MGSISLYNILSYIREYVRNAPTIKGEKIRVIGEIILWIDF